MRGPRSDGSGGRLLFLSCRFVGRRPALDAPPHVLVANEPLVYREIVAEGLRALRPGLRIREVALADLEATIDGHRPSLAITSQPSAIVRRWATATLVLYPEGRNEAVLVIGDATRVVANPRLPDLLAAVDAVIP